MASDNEASCENDPNFAVICAFLEKFGGSCGLTNIDFLELQEMLENTQEVSQALIDLHIKLMRKARKSVSNERWERAVIKICHGFCTQDAWEIERFGYKKARVSCKLRILKELLEMQFDFNSKFKTDINKMTADELRSLPFGRDKLGHAYWIQTDDNCQIRVYKEDIDEETWSLVAKDRESFISLISELGGDTDSKLSSESLGNEDSNSLAEKPIMDTGQVESSSSDSIKKSLTESEDSEEKKSEDISSSKDIKTDISNDSEETQDKPDPKPNESVKRANDTGDNLDEQVAKRPKITFKNLPEPEVSKAIEEPVFKVQGEGSGAENETGNCIVSEEIEEDVLYFYGDGSGCDNLTGNHSTSESSDSKSEEQTNSASTSYINNINKSDLSSSEKVTEVPTKTPYKLGTILDTKTDNKLTSPRSPTRKSKWDVETPEKASNEVDKTDNNIQEISKSTGNVKDLVNKFEQINEEKESPKKAVFFFGPGSSPFKSTNPSTSLMGFGLSSISPLEKEGIQINEESQKNDQDSNIAQKEYESSKDNEGINDSISDKLEIKKDIIKEIDSPKHVAVSIVEETNKHSEEVQKKESELKQIDSKLELDDISSNEGSLSRIDDEIETLSSKEIVASKVDETNKHSNEVESKEQIDSKLELDDISSNEGSLSRIDDENMDNKNEETTKKIGEPTIEVKETENEIQPETSSLKVSNENVSLKSSAADNKNEETEIKMSEKTIEVKETECETQSRQIKIDSQDDLTALKRVEGCINLNKPHNIYIEENEDETEDTTRALNVEKIFKNVNYESTDAENKASEALPIEKTCEKAPAKIKELLNKEKPDCVIVISENENSSSDSLMLETKNMLEVTKKMIDKCEVDEDKNELNVPVNKNEATLQQNSDVVKEDQTLIEKLTVEEKVQSESKLQEPLEIINVDKKSVADTVKQSIKGSLQNKTSNLEEAANKTVQIVSAQIKDTINENKATLLQSRDIENVHETLIKTVNVEENVQNKSKIQEPLEIKETINIADTVDKLTKSSVQNETINLEKTSKRTDLIESAQIEDTKKSEEIAQIELNKIEINKETDIEEKKSIEIKTSKVEVKISDPLQTLPETENIENSKKTELEPPEKSEVIAIKISNESSKVEKKELKSEVSGQDDIKTIEVCKKELKTNLKVSSSDNHKADEMPECTAITEVSKVVTNETNLEINNLSELQDHKKPLTVKPESKEKSSKNIESKDSKNHETNQNNDDKESKNEAKMNTSKSISELKKENIINTDKEEDSKDNKINLRTSESKENKGKLELQQSEKKLSNNTDNKSEDCDIKKIKGDKNVEEKTDQTITTVAKKTEKLENEDACSKNKEPLKEDEEQSSKKMARSKREATKKVTKSQTKLDNTEPVTKKLKEDIGTNNLEKVKEKTPSGSEKSNENSENEGGRSTRQSKRLQLPTENINVKKESVVSESKKPEIRKRGRNASPETVKSHEIIEESEENVVQTRRGKITKPKPTSVKTKTPVKEELIKETPKKQKLSIQEVPSEPEVDVEPVVETRVTRTTRSSHQIVETSLPVETKKTKSKSPETKKGKNPPSKTKITSVKETKSITSTPSPQSVLSVNLDCDVIDTGSDVVEVPEKDPLATESDVESVKPSNKSMTLQSLSFDFNESPTPTPPPITRRSMRKRGLESPVNVLETEEILGKKPKLKGKRSVDVQLRKSIEEQKRLQVSSSEDDNNSEKNRSSPKKKSPPKKGGNKKIYNFSKKKVNKSPAQSSEGETSRNNTPPVKKKKNEANRNMRILKNLGIDPDKIDTLGETNVRQSRRIAQIKIKEDAERDYIPEKQIEKKPEKSDKKSEKKSSKKSKEEKKSEKRKRKEQAALEEEQEDSDKDKKKKRKKSKKHLFDTSHPWQTSSDDSDENECDEEEDIVEYSDHEEREPIQLKSDHEFSPESEDDDEEYQPTKRARTARKETDEEVEEDEYACQKCGKSDHPEFILLCDKCDNGWHCSCLRPALFVIPEGDWFCPPCQHITLIQKLEQELIVLDKKLAKKEVEDRRKERLAYVGISLNNVLKPKKRRDSHGNLIDNRSESESDSSSGSSSETDSDEPIYQLRQRRQAKTYRFNDYDELINSAIQDEMDAVKGAGNQGRGKDISTIINAEKEEELEKKKAAQELSGNTLPEDKPPVVPIQGAEDIKEPFDQTDPDSGHVKKIGRKKPRKLNNLDVVSSEDDGSDEDFKGSSSEQEEEDFEDEENLTDSDDYLGKKRRNAGPLRRSTRARVSRYDGEFIDDSSSDTAPRRKKKKSIWDDTESEESEGGWGGSRRKKQQRHSVSRRKKSKKKKKGSLDDSDLDSYKKKKKPKIRYGLSSDDDDDAKGRRTRGRKMNYVEALGSDSEDDKQGQSHKKTSDEEYVGNEEEEDEVVSEEDKENDESSDENVNNVPKFKAKARRIIDDSEDEQEEEQPKAQEKITESVETPSNPDREKEKVESDLNSSDEKLKSLDEMDEAEIEKMMEDEEYANRQLQLVAMQIEKNKKKQYVQPRPLDSMKINTKKEEEFKPKIEKQIVANVTIQKPPQIPPPTPQVKTNCLENLAKIGGITIRRVQPPPVVPPLPAAVSVVAVKKQQIIEDVERHDDSMEEDLIVNSIDNDDLSEPPGVSIPMFSELTLTKISPDKNKKPSRAKKSIRDALASMELARQGQKLTEITIVPAVKRKPQQSTSPPTSQVDTPANANIEIAAPPQPFSQTQPAPSVITRMLQSAPQNQQPTPPKNNYPVGTIRPKQFAMLTERDDDDEPVRPPLPTVVERPPGPPAHFIPGGPRGSVQGAYRHMPPNIASYGRGAPPPHIVRNPGPQAMPPHLYHPHRSLDPSPSGGGPINIPGRNSPATAPPPPPSISNSPNTKPDGTPPPPYVRGPPPPRMQQPNTTPRQIHPPAHMLHPSTRAPHMPPFPIQAQQNYHYGGYPAPPQTTPVSTAEDAFQSSPYPPPDQYMSNERLPNSPSDNSNSKSYDEESGGEFGGLVSYFSSQHEDDLES